MGKYIWILAGCLSLFILTGFILVMTSSTLGEKTVKSPYEKIDDSLWTQIVDEEPATTQIQSAVQRRAQAVASNKVYPVIVQYSRNNNRAELRSINADAEKLNSAQIISMAQDVQIEKIYLDSEVKIDLRESVPLMNGKAIISTAGQGAKVCILDTGIDDNHPALKTPIAQYDFVNGDSDANDDQFHGTHVAGIVVSSDNINRGVAPSTDLLIGKVMDNTGHGWYSWIIQGIEWCVDNDADVISMSLGGGVYQTTCDEDVLAQTANWAVEQGVIVVASSGNNGKAGGGSPACGSKVISVTSTDDQKGQVASWASKTSEVDVSAGGSYVTSTVPNNGWETWSGTSMACPLVSGSVALLKSVFPSATPEEITTALYSTAKCYRSRCEFGEGHGLINVFQACLYLQNNGKNVGESNNGVTYTSSGSTASASVGRSKIIPSCFSYVNDGDYFSASEDGEKFFTGKKKCTTRKNVTTCTEKSSYTLPTNIYFHTQEGYPVEITGSRGRYTFYVWYDTTVDKKIQDKANAWVFSPLTTKDIYTVPIDELEKSTDCGICNEVFKSKPFLS